EGPVRPDGAGVRALGHVPRAELPALYAAADVLVLPSIRTATFTEPWGLVCNEAMHQSTPIVATDAVGAVAGGLVRDGRNGLVAPERDAAALAARLRAVAYAPELRARLGAAARAARGGELDGRLPGPARPGPLRRHPRRGPGVSQAVGSPGQWRRPGRTRGRGRRARALRRLRRLGGAGRRARHEPPAPAAGCARRRVRALE
ncbi:MAG: glycosyltransferase, partial [Gemmatimonadetes bacterium]|nr:glycosyltransferase [Gemmatimonadota bacterium]